MSNSFFENLVVIELASVLAGPYAGRFFREHGAQVIKIENPKQGGDVTRTWRNGNEKSDGISAYYASVNQGKKVIFLDLTTAEGHQKLLELLDSADILLTNFRIGEDEKFNLKLEVLKEQFPQLIIGQIDGFGLDDPRAAYDMVLQAESGYLSMTGSKNHPAKLPVALIDVLAGQQLKTGILMAMLQKQSSGKGGIVRVSLKDAAIASLMNQSANYLMSNWIPTAMGTLHPNIAPYGEYCRCKDGKDLVLAIGNNKQFEALLHVLDLHQLLNDVRFKENPDRVKNREALHLILNEAFKNAALDVWMKALVSVGVPAGAIKSVDEVLSDPSVAWMIEEEITCEGQILKSVKTSPIRFQ
jgi:crotonobetainyl-CoA:carnitine CoA-transferase CaiB-like acyl-CoA transferase